MHRLRRQQQTVPVVQTKPKLAPRPQAGESALPRATLPLHVDGLASKGQGGFPGSQDSAPEGRRPSNGRGDLRMPLKSSTLSTSRPSAGLDPCRRIVEGRAAPGRTQAHVNADADDDERRRISSQAASARTPATLRRASRTSFGHLISASTPRRASASRTDRAPTAVQPPMSSGNRAPRPKHDAERQCRAGRCEPAATFAAAARRLFVGHHQRSVGAAAVRQLLRAIVGRAEGGLVVQVARPTSPPGSTPAGALRSTCRAL